MAERKKVTFICSASMSGTSMVAKVMFDNGAWSGDLKDYSEGGYEIYENERFRQLCRNCLRIDRDLGDQDFMQLFSEFFKSLPENENIVLKYPKSFNLMEAFIKFFGHRLDMRIIYVIRNIYQRAISYQERTEVKNFAAGLYEWNAAYLALAKVPLPLYTVLWEHIFIMPEDEVSRLLTFAGIQFEELDLSAIDQSQRHF